MSESAAVEAGHGGSRPGLVSVFSNIAHLKTHMFTILYATAVLHLPGVFDMSYGELLGLSSFGLILYGVAALPAGWLGDKWSQAGMIAVFFLGCGVGSIVVGLAESTATLFVGLTLIGLFASIYHPVGIAWLVASGVWPSIQMPCHLRLRWLLRSIAGRAEKAGYVRIPLP